MIYCNLKVNNGNSAIYLFGADTENITGEAILYSSFTEPTVLKQPENEELPVSMLVKIVIKYKEELAKGNFPSRMSYGR